MVTWASAGPPPGQLSHDGDNEGVDAAEAGGLGVRQGRKCPARGRGGRPHCTVTLGSGAWLVPAVLSSEARELLGPESGGP